MTPDWNPTVTVRWPVTVACHYNDGSIYDRVRRRTLQPGERLEKRRTTLTVDGPPWQHIALDRENGETILFGGAYERDYQTFLEGGYFEEATPVCQNDHLIPEEDRP